MKFSRSIMLPLAGLAVLAALSGCGSNNNLTGLNQTDTTPPPAPTNLSVTTDANGNPQLVWDASAAADVVGYQVQVFNASNPDYVQAADPISTDTSCLLPPAGANVQESYRVRATDASGNWSAFSAPVDVVRPDKPGDPIGIQ